MKSRVAQMTGTFLTPGVSANKRLYKAEHIASAVEKMQERLQKGEGLPVTMLTGHPKEGSGEDVTKIVGGVREVWVDEQGRAHFRADIPDTVAGRDLAALTHGTTPYLGSVSIRGNWIGKIRTESAGSHGPVTTADGIEVEAIDYTARPGVSGARIESVTLEQSEAAHQTESVEEGRRIVEAVEVAVAINEADQSCPTCGFDRATTEERTVPESKKNDAAPEQPQESAPAARALTEADIPTLVAAFKEATKPVEEPVAEADKAASLTESVQKSVTEAVAAAKEAWKEEVKAELREQLAKEGFSGRRGLVVSEKDADKPSKPIHEMDDEEFRAYKRDTISGVFGIAQ
ncbi:MAG: hypothetical protein NVS3B21_34390 [Acidimicrobiales bacterium]